MDNYIKIFNKIFDRNTTIFDKLEMIEEVQAIKNTQTAHPDEESLIKLIVSGNSMRIVDDFEVTYKHFIIYTISDKTIEALLVYFENCLVLSPSNNVYQKILTLLYIMQDVPEEYISDNYHKYRAYDMINHNIVIFRPLSKEFVNKHYKNIPRLLLVAIYRDVLPDDVRDSVIDSISLLNQMKLGIVTDEDEIITGISNISSRNTRRRYAAYIISSPKYSSDIKLYAKMIM